MEFGVLGPTRVTSGGSELNIGGPRRRLVLTYLVRHADDPVTVLSLAADLAGVDESPAAAATLRSHLTKLRSILGPDRLDNTPRGWVLAIAPNELDASLFETEVHQAAAQLATDPTSAATLLDASLARWRGPAYADAAGADWSIVEANRLDDLRVRAEELLVDALLGSGHPEEAVTRAEGFLVHDANQEGLWSRLMLGLYRCDRKADALRGYQRFRQLSREPSDSLKNLERAITFDDPELHSNRSVDFFKTEARSPSKGAVDPSMPQGITTFLMTDIVGSTLLWDRATTQMTAAVARHEELITDAVEAHGGRVLAERGEGDSTFSVFHRPTDAAAAALTAQLFLASEPWSPECVIRVRMAIGTGEALLRDGEWWGPIVNRVARLRAMAEPGQILVTQSSAEIIIDHLPEGARLVSLGVHHLKNVERPQHVYALTSPSSPGPSAVAENDVDTSTTPVGRSTMVDEGWVLTVRADRAFSETNELEGQAFPDWNYEQTIELVSSRVTIGRAGVNVTPDIDIAQVTGDKKVSRAHAVLQMRDRCWTIVDLGSTNGTYVNTIDDPIEPGVARVLEPGDRIYLGAWTRLRLGRATD